MLAAILKLMVIIMTAIENGQLTVITKPTSEPVTLAEMKALNTELKAQLQTTQNEVDRLIETEERLNKEVTYVKYVQRVLEKEKQVVMKNPKIREDRILNTIKKDLQLKELPVIDFSLVSEYSYHAHYDTKHKQGAIVEFSIPETLGTTKVSKLIPLTATANFQDLEAR